MNSSAPPSRRLQWAVWGGMATTVVVIFLAFVTQRREPPLPVLFSIPDFALTNQDNQLVTLSSLRGQVWLADIIFTRCMGPCPELARRTAELQKVLPARLPVRFITLTTDPEYDTPAVLQAHGRRFGAVAGRWHFLTGSKKAIADLAVGGLKLTALDKDSAQRENPADLFIHSTQFVLVDRAGRARAVFENEDPAMTDKAVRAVRRLLAER